jgi:hypothetical protein
MVSKRAVNEIVKDYLEEQGFDEIEQMDLIKMFNKDIREIKKKRDDEPVVDHGTTCIRIRSQDEKTVLCDL